MDTTTSGQANNGQASRPSSRGRGVPMPPGMTEEIRRANIRQYWEDKKLFDETIKNTKFNKNITNIDQANHGQASPPSSKRKGASIPPGMTAGARQVRNRQHWEDKKLADQIPKNTKLNKSITWADLSHPIQPQEPSARRNKWRIVGREEGTVEDKAKSAPSSGTHLKPRKSWK
ncbi:uncharacterized protein MKZ38_007450 [Zalerion maritima]|uniref:Uncharacterized protein n=1 Tax=Zalerion maritima TaxID=339359 RepID=A0AAD5RIT9_9PEZI|nr:uncharacterized protein MKZ38_007450 [Zalerion maritima]